MNGTLRATKAVRPSELSQSVPPAGPAPLAGPAGRSGPEGWYLFGITRCDHSAGTLGTGPAGGTEMARLEADDIRVLAYRELAAVVRPVPLGEFRAEELRERPAGPAPLDDAAWLETMVRRHDRVLEAIQRDRVVLPAKFASVYASTADLLAALESAHDGLLAQLNRLAGCDEWGVRLYADPTTVRRHLGEADPTIAQLRQTLATARPGRAYFLQRQVTEALAEATGHEFDALAGAAHELLAGRAVAAQVSAHSSTAAAADQSVEILRATFLIRRADQGPFFEALQHFVESRSGLSAGYTGPWPPYSFARYGEETAQ